MAERIDLVDKNGKVQVSNILRSAYDTSRDAYPGLYMQIVIVLGVNAVGELLVHERSPQYKTVDPGKIDKICETVQGGENQSSAAIRGLSEESGLTTSPTNLVLVEAGVNEYQRYRTLYGVILDDEMPSVRNPREVSWVQFMPTESLIKAAQDHTMYFVDGFFTDSALALNALQTHPATPADLGASLGRSATILEQFLSNAQM